MLSLAKQVKLLTVASNIKLRFNILLNHYIILRGTKIQQGGIVIISLIRLSQILTKT